MPVKIKTKKFRRTKDDPSEQILFIAVSSPFLQTDSVSIGQYLENHKTQVKISKILFYLKRDYFSAYFLQLLLQIKQSNQLRCAIITDVSFVEEFRLGPLADLALVGDNDKTVLAKL